MPSLFSKLFGRRPVEPSPRTHTSGPPEAVPLNGQLDYDKAIILDAEDLAEQGIADAYRRILPELEAYVPAPAQIEEVLDDELPSYLIRCNGKEYLVYSANEPGTEQESWGRATYFLFHIINEQLSATPVRFYAINGGNDLCGMFLTPDEARDAQTHLPRRSDWPYTPENVSPNYGQFT